MLIKNVLIYTIIALASLVVISSITPNFLRIDRLELTGVDAILFGIMMAIGEERVFRGGLFDRFYYSTKSLILTGLLTSAIFTIYHLAVYQNDLAAMIYVFSAGLLLAYINIIAGVSSPSLIAHIGANILAYSPLGLAGMSFILEPSFILLTGAIFTVLVIIIVRTKQRRR
jgi:membrane protease YdiL (CAAX protease family)